MKCDACYSAKNVGDYRAGLNQAHICNDCFEKSHIAIAAKINTRKNEEIEAKDAEIARMRAEIAAMRRCEICKHYDAIWVGRNPCIGCADTTNLPKWELAK
jgi:hypothetical protein